MSSLVKSLNNILMERKKNRRNIVKKNFCRRNKVNLSMACFFAARNKICAEIPSASPMKKSKKCTNMTKYKNINDEPRLVTPFGRYLVLRRYDKPKKNAKRNHKLGIYDTSGSSGSYSCNTFSTSRETNELRVILDKKDIIETSSHDMVKAHSYYDTITDKLLSIFGGEINNKIEVKSSINRFIRNLYEATVYNTNPVNKILKCLLEFWLKHNTSETKPTNPNTLKYFRSIHIQSSFNITHVDKNVSCMPVNIDVKETQFVDKIYSDLQRTGTNVPNTYLVTSQKFQPHVVHRDTESFEKERCVQQLERLLKSTVYVCKTARSSQIKERDIKITKKLIDNLEMYSTKTEVEKSTDESTENISNSSSELPAIQDTFHHLLSETSLPADLAKEFFNAYLGILRNDVSKSSTTESSAQSSDDAHINEESSCKVQRESVHKSISKGVVTDDILDIIDHGENSNDNNIYLKDIARNLKTLFSNRYWLNRKAAEPADNEIKDELGRSVKDPIECLVQEDRDEALLTLDLTKYDLQNITMSKDVDVKGAMSITIKFKENAVQQGELKKGRLNLTFSNKIPLAQ